MFGISKRYLLIIDNVHKIASTLELTTQTHFKEGSNPLQLLGNTLLILAEG